MIQKIKDILDISPKYIVDSEGKKLAVILEISTYENMIEILENHYCIVQTHNNEAKQ